MMKPSGAKRNPFDYVKSIQNGRLPIKDVDREYIPWLINNALSYYIDSVYAANLINRYPNIPIQSQYDFLYGVIDKRRRPFNRMSKGVDDQDLELISRVFSINKSKGREILELLTDAQLNELRLEYYKGGEK